MIFLLCVTLFNAVHGRKPAAMLELKPSYFFFTNSPLSKIYKRGGFEMQTSGSCQLWKWLDVYGSVGVMQTWGKSLNDGQKTSLLEVPVDLGLKPHFVLHKKVDYYFAFGPRYFYLHQYNDSTFVDKNIHNNVMGFFVNTGFNFEPVKHCTVGIFGEYAYGKTSFSSCKPNVFGQKNVQIGGCNFGVSLGYRF